jgi:glycogen(starch) synthase
MYSRYYNLIDVLVYPRHSMRLTELVTPLKPLEAMAQGRLLVASDVGGHRELIRDGETGILFKRRRCRRSRAQRAAACSRTA